MSKNDNKKSIYEGDEENPFRIPPDEKIFSFKEEEKDRKIEEREKNKSMKVLGKTDQLEKDVSEKFVKPILNRLP